MKRFWEWFDDLTWGFMPALLAFAMFIIWQA